MSHEKVDQPPQAKALPFKGSDMIVKTCDAIMPNELYVFSQNFLNEYVK